ncbi:unnamed protein product [Rangifer tarandus platyrhynchus]|uniref:Uncharacterized protein n=1 Tax=Rangifer tarandus platyrhynchus TaxID=3082113 RepID=A0AC59ZJL2_RANTA
MTSEKRGPMEPVWAAGPTSERTQPRDCPRNRRKTELQALGTAVLRTFASEAPAGPEGTNANYGRGSHRSLQFGVGVNRADSKQGIAFSPTAGKWRPLVPEELAGGSCRSRGRSAFGAGPTRCPCL